MHGERPGFWNPYTPMSPKPFLHGCSVLVPRPRSRGEAVARAIEACGGSAIVFPVIDIGEIRDCTGLDRCLDEIDSVDLLVFVSVPAVEGFVRRQQALGAGLSRETKVAAVGPRTLACSESSGLCVDFAPDRRMDSEGLLEALGDFDVNGKNVTIVRGQDGREFLGRELEKLGAQVQYVAAYTRSTTTHSISPVLEQWVANPIHCVLITSVSILDALVELLGEANRGLLEETPVVTISSRIARACRRNGIKEVFVAENTGETGVVEAVSLACDGKRPVSGSSVGGKYPGHDKLPGLG